jgi:hypothetical protein
LAAISSGVRSHTYFLPQHTLFQQIRKPEALCWCIPIQAFYVDDFEKQVMVIMLLRGTLSTRTLYGGFAVVMDMFCKQHKTSSIPYSTLKALNWRIAFLIAEGKREIGVIGKHL